MPDADYRIESDGLVIVFLSEASTLRTSPPGRIKIGARLAFKTKHDTEQFVLAGEREGFTFDGKVFLLRQWKTEAENEGFESIGKTVSPNVTSVPIADKWVGLGYEGKSGLASKLKTQGYELHWSSGDREAELVDIGGWEHVLVEQPDGTKARLKIHDHPAVGGYLVLLKKRK